MIFSRLASTGVVHYCTVRLPSFVTDTVIISNSTYVRTQRPTHREVSTEHPPRLLRGHVAHYRYVSNVTYCRSVLYVRLDGQVAQSPKRRRLFPPQLQRLRRRTTAADDSANGGVSGHVINPQATTTTDAARTQATSSAAADDFRDNCQNCRRAVTLLDVMHKKFYPGQYGAASAGSDVDPRRTRRDQKTRPGDDCAPYRSAATASIIGDSQEGASCQATPDRSLAGNYSIHSVSV